MFYEKVHEVVAQVDWYWWNYVRETVNWQNGT